MERRKKQKKERKLTAAEQKRKEMFLEKKAALEAEGFEAHDLTISAVYANVMAVVLALPILLVLWAVFVWKNGHGSISSPMLLVVLVLFFLLIVVHEAIHGLFWSFFAKNKWKSISFGIMWNSLTLLYLSGGIDKGAVCHWRSDALCAAGDCAGNCGYFSGELAFVLGRCADDSGGRRRFDHTLETVFFF